MRKTIAMLLALSLLLCVSLSVSADLNPVHIGANFAGVFKLQSQKKFLTNTLVLGVLKYLIALSPDMLGILL